MRKTLSTIGWGILSFVIAQGVFAFISGVVFSTIAASDVRLDNFPRLFAQAGTFFAIMISLMVVLLSIRDRLPGTKDRGQAMAANTPISTQETDNQ